MLETLRQHITDDLPRFMERLCGLGPAEKREA